MFVQITNFQRLHSANKWIKISTCRSWHESNTYRAIEFSLLIHSKVKATVYTSYADQSHCYTDEFKDTWYQRRKKEREKKIILIELVTKMNKIIFKIYMEYAYIIWPTFSETSTTIWKHIQCSHESRLRSLIQVKESCFIWRNFFFSTLNFNDERFSFITQAKTFGTMWLQSIMIRRCLPSCLLKHQEIGLDYLKIYFTFSIALS